MRSNGAYALLLQGERGKLGQPTIYRALDFLLTGKLIRKIQSVSAQVACGDVEHPHKSQLMICDHCGAAEKLRGDEIFANLRRLGEGRGFAVARQVIEIGCVPPAGLPMAERAPAERPLPQPTRTSAPPSTGRATPVMKLASSKATI